MADRCYTLDLLLEGPFAICADSDQDRCLQILVPDLLDSHFTPGFVASDGGVDLESGMFALEITRCVSAPKENRMALLDSDITLDMVQCKRREDPGAYLILEVPKPDEVCPISGTRATIVPPSDPTVDPMTTHRYCTRVVLRYNLVKDVKVHGALVDKSGTDSLTLVMTPLGGQAVLVFDMKPKQAPGREHAMMAYRAIASMVGVARYMTPRDHSLLDHTDHNDCKAALIFAVPKNSDILKIQGTGSVSSK